MKPPNHNKEANHRKQQPGRKSRSLVQKSCPAFTHTNMISLPYLSTAEAITHIIACKKHLKSTHSIILESRCGKTCLWMPALFNSRAAVATSSCERTLSDKLGALLSHASGKSIIFISSFLQEFVNLHIRHSWLIVWKPSPVYHQKPLFPNPLRFPVSIEEVILAFRV